MTSVEQEIRERHQQQEQPTNEQPATEPPTATDAEAGLTARLPSLSKRQLAALTALLVVVVLVLYLKKSNESDDFQSEVVIEDDQDGKDIEDDGSEMVLPVNPSESHEIDAAVTSMFRDRGTLMVDGEE